MLRMKTKPTANPTTTGRDLRDQRLAKGIKASFVHRTMGISGAYLSDLEADRRHWSDKLIEGYRKAVGLTAGPESKP